MPANVSVCGSWEFVLAVIALAVNSPLELFFVEFLCYFLAPTSCAYLLLVNVGSNKAAALATKQIVWRRR